MCVCARTYTHLHLHTHTHTHTHTHARTHARTHTRTHSHTHARTHARTHTHTPNHTTCTGAGEKGRGERCDVMEVRQSEGVSTGGLAGQSGQFLCCIHHRVHRYGEHSRSQVLQLDHRCQLSVTVRDGEGARYKIILYYTRVKIQSAHVCFCTNQSLMTNTATLNTSNKNTNNYGEKNNIKKSENNYSRKLHNIQT